jgi:glutamate-1-semialdehyde aminotransferase
MLSDGVYWVPAQFEAAFLSAAHGAQELDFTEAAAVRALRAARDGVD